MNSPRIYRHRSPEGTCIMCRKEPSAPDRKSCPSCLADKAAKRAAYKLANPKPVEEPLEFPPEPKIWQLPWRGKCWHQMPGDNDDIKKMNFFFFRRGMYDPSKAVADRWAERPSMFTFPGRVA